MGKKVDKEIERIIKRDIKKAARKRDGEAEVIFRVAVEAAMFYAENGGDAEVTYTEETED